MDNFRTTVLSAIISAAALISTAAFAAPPKFDRDMAVATIKTLSADDMGGRRTGTKGSTKAQAYLLGLIADLNVDMVGPTHEHKFKFTNEAQDGTKTDYVGTNLLFRIKGTGDTGKTIVISAHYDHMGAQGGQVFNGADDNASGVAGVLAVAEHFKANPPKNDMIFALFDAEEMGLQGARAFVRNIKRIDPNIAFNINFDMLSRSDKNELYVAGAFHRAALVPVIDAIAKKAPVTLLKGHDDPALGANDWTFASDHGPFHQAEIPFLYFGVEDHPHYHKPSDDFETVPVDFFLRSIETVVLAADEVDGSLESIAKQRSVAR